jgi:MATE family multidrug resistance protein
MVIADRVILSHYSTEAFNACFGAIQWYWALLATTLEFALIAEVFVGQCNGAQRFKEIGPVVWQMIWFCCALFLLFIPLALWGTPYLLANNIAELGAPYLRILLIFIPIDGIGFGALTAFFVGRGKTWIVSIAAVLSGLLNIILDFILIFGCGIIPRYGIVGAATATVISQSLLGLGLFAVFLKKSHRERYGTGEVALKPALLKECLAIGFPSALNHLINTLLWAAMTQVIAQHVSSEDFQAYGIAHSIHMLFAFIIDGMSIGTRTICANALGAHRFEIVPKNLRAWLFLSALATALTAVGMLIYPDNIINAFLKESETGIAHTLVQHMLLWTWIVFTLDLVAYNLRSVLLASGDTKFIMGVNVLSFASCFVFPTYIGIVYFDCRPVIFWRFMALNCAACIIFFALRYRRGHWRQRTLI